MFVGNGGNRGVESGEGRGVLVSLAREARNRRRRSEIRYGLFVHFLDLTERSGRVEYSRKKTLAQIQVSR